jgi:hypothetical protein
MCRYAMVTYKPHYACFKCRKSFKRKLMRDVNRDDKIMVEAKCPQCGELMANMGFDFESPKKDDINKWKHIKSLFSVGITFHSCGCGGPGYIPKTKDKLLEYFEDLKVNYNEQLDFWRKRKEPSNQSEIDREKSNDWNYIGRTPYEKRTKNGTISNEEARLYWMQKIKEIDEKMEKIKQ